MTMATALYVSERLKELQVTAKEILGERYEQEIEPFKECIGLWQKERNCSASDAALIVVKELKKTGHDTVLVFAALAELIEESREIKQGAV